MARLAATINGLFALPRVLVLMDGGAGIISNDELADLPFLLRIGGGGDGRHWDVRPFRFDFRCGDVEALVAGEGQFGSSWPSFVKPIVIIGGERC